MKIGIVGYGKMGKIIEEIAIERGHEIIGKYNSSNPLNDTNWIPCDVAIEFTNPESAVANIEFLSRKKIPVIVGSTGWYNDYQRVTERIILDNSAILSATNFSLGVNLFWKMAEYMSNLMQTHTNYTVGISEIHHTEKKDAPSGTAITLAEKVLGAQTVLNDWKLETTIQVANAEDASNYSSPDKLVFNKLEDNKLPIIAIREPHVPGTHELHFQGEFDEISLLHKAKNRKGFATGAVIAAEWIKDRKGVFQMSDLLKFEN